MKPHVLLLFICLLPQSVSAEKPSSRASSPKQSPPAGFTRTVLLPDLRSDIIPKATSRRCGPFAVACLLQAAGHRLDDDRLKEITDLDADKDGTSAQTLSAYLEKVYSAKTCASPSLAELREHIDTGAPVLLAVDDGGYHWVLLAGYDRHPDGRYTWHLVDNGVSQASVTTERLLELRHDLEHSSNYAVFFHPKERVLRKQVTLSAFPTINTRTENDLRLLSALTGEDAPRDPSTVDECQDILDDYFNVRYTRTGTPSELCKQIDAGYPPVLLRKSETYRHFSLVVGYTLDGSGRPLSWNLVDGYTAGELPHQRFLSSWHIEYEDSQFWIALLLAKKGDS